MFVLILAMFCCMPAAAAAAAAGAGRVLRWRTPAAAQQFDHTAAIRVDSGVSEGDTVSRVRRAMTIQISFVQLHQQC
jgi:acetyl/propionyl-CoA carboxylase alpha subunit